MTFYSSELETAPSGAVIYYQLLANGTQLWIFNETIGNGNITLRNDGTRIIYNGGVLSEVSRSAGIDDETGPVATITLFMNGTQLYDIWHGPLMPMFINGTQTIDDRGFP